MTSSADIVDPLEGTVHKTTDEYSMLRFTGTFTKLS